MNILVGGSKVDITPPLTIPYLGFYPRQAYFTGVHDPLYARALVFDNGWERVGILCFDGVGFDNHLLGKDRHLTDELRARIAARCGIRPDHSLISPTHAHSTPETLGITRLMDAPSAPAWLETLLDQLASAMQMACEDMALCALKVGSGEVLGVAHNRRPFCKGTPLEEQVKRGKLDPQLQLLLCEDEKGYARHVLMNFACHPVVMQVQPLISADFPGVATRLVEQNLEGCRSCLFLQGASGNLNPVRDDSRDFRDVTLYGTAIAGEALKVTACLLGEAGTAMSDVVIGTASERVTIPPRSMPTRDEWVEKLNERMEVERYAVTDEEKREAGIKTRQARETLDLIARFSQPQEAEAQVLRIGDLAIAGTPGEMFTEWGLQIKRESAAPHTFIAGLANGWVGYLLDPGGFAEGGYEAAYGPWTQTDERGSAILTEGAICLIQRLWS